jgi:hypothetical protein
MAGNYQQPELRGSGDHLVDNFHRHPAFIVVFILGSLIIVFDYVNNFFLGAGRVHYTFLPYVVLALLSWFLLSKHLEGDSKTLWLPFARMTFFTVFFPLFFPWLSRLGDMTGTWYGALFTGWVGLAIPLFLWYLLGWPSYLLSQATHLRGLGFFASLLQLAILFGVVVSLLGPIGDAIDTRISPSADFESPGVMELLKRNWELAKGLAERSYSGVRGRVNDSMEPFLEQPRYVGQVESQQGAQLGVFIREVQPVKPVFYLRGDNETLVDGDDAIFFGKIQARTFTDEIALDLSCAYQYNDIVVQGDIRPGELLVHYTGDFVDEFPFECIISADSVISAFDNWRDALRGEFVVQASFGFQTWGYTTLTFMERDMMNALRREGIDPARSLGISPRPIARYTPGPLSLGMETISQPIGVSLSQPAGNTLPSLGVTLENVWRANGQIERVNSLVLQAPNVFELDTNRCIGATVSEVLGPQMMYDGETVPAGYTWYLFDTVDFDGERYKTVRCPLDPRSGWSSLLQPDFSARQFTLVSMVDYDYNLTQRVGARYALEAVR